jgi:MbtH protein
VLLTSCLYNPVLSLRFFDRFFYPTIALIGVGMSVDSNQAEVLYEVVVNDEEQYSIWPADKALPLGWKKAGKAGTKEACLEYVKEVWTDMRPLSLRKQMASAAN